MPGTSRAPLPPPSGAYRRDVGQAGTGSRPLHRHRAAEHRYGGVGQDKESPPVLTSPISYPPSIPPIPSTLPRSPDPPSASMAFTPPCPVGEARTDAFVQAHGGEEAAFDHLVEPASLILVTLLKVALGERGLRQPHSPGGRRVAGSVGGWPGADYQVSCRPCFIIFYPTSTSAQCEEDAFKSTPSPCPIPHPPVHAPHRAALKACIPDSDAKQALLQRSSAELKLPNNPLVRAIDPGEGRGISGIGTAALIRAWRH